MIRRLLFTKTNPKGGLLARAAWHLPLLLLSIFAFTELDAQTSINVSFSVQEPACFGLPNGKITANATGGTAPYSYVWSTGAMGATLNGVSAGSYSVTVTDAASKMAVQNITLNQPALVSANITVEAECNGPFTLTGVGGGGVQPYKYYWTTGQTSQSITVAAGNYCVTITDQNFCGAVKCITVDSEPLTASVTATAVTCPDDTDGTATAIPEGGMAPYTYSWSNEATTQTINNLAPGLYTVTVTDARGCTAIASATVASRPPLVISFLVTNPTCVGESDGMVIAEVTGGTGPYTYRWNTGVTTQGLFGIAAGTYTVTVTDNKGCEAEKSVVLTPQSALEIIVTGNNERCPDEENGSATATPSNGVAPYVYAWSNGGTTQTISNLAPGSYGVTVTDAVGCEATGSYMVLAAAPLEITVTGTNVTTCEASDGTATAGIDDGDGPFIFLWNTGATTQTITDLNGGIYIVTVTDTHGCTAVDSVSITEPPAISVDVEATGTVCPGATTGSAKAIVSGGTAPFTYAWNNEATADSISNLGAGTYIVTVTDANGCIAIDSATINESPAILATINADSIICGPMAMASATVQVSGGLPPYTFLWSTGVMTQTIIGLPAGSYSVTVTDANGCTAEDEITITSIVLEAAITTTDILCFGADDGTAKVEVSGGTEPYVFQWSNGATVDSVGNLSAGDYSVTITDANECQTILSATITQPTLLEIEITADTLVCPSNTDAFAKVVATGGTQPYTFLWNTEATTDSIGGIGAGTYIVTVTDGNGCTAVDSVTILESPELNLEIAATEVICGAENTGNASVIASGGQAPYTYEWSTGDSTSIIEDLLGGTYSVTVTDANGCTAMAEATVRIISDFAVSVIQRNLLCHNDSTGSILAIAEGGDAPYTYAWNTGDTIAEIANLAAGVYTLTVTDANDCAVVQTITLTQPPMLTANATGNNLTCFEAEDGSVTVTASGGTEPYTYAWSSGPTTDSVNNLPAGDYTVTVTDANFCTIVAAVTITQPAQLTATINANSIICHGEMTGMATVTPAGGTAPYTYAWSNDATTQTIAGLGEGNYSVTVTDANDCTVVVNITIEEPPLLELTLTVNNIVCTSEQIGAISTIVSGGTAPYTYAWSNDATTAAIMNLPGGTYSVTVTDANGCTATATTGVLEIPNLELTISKTDVTCFDLEDGTATVMVTGDTPPYSYVWSTGDTTATVSGLAPGMYMVTVRGTAGCIGEAQVVIEAPTELSLTIEKTDASCIGEADGSCTAIPAGGTAPYTYNWSTGDATATISGLAAGTYMVTVTDANECTTTGSVTIGEPDAITVTLTIAQGTCEGDANGSITSEVSGGTAPYTYAWSNEATTPAVNDLPAGNYSVTVTDANGCTNTASIELATFAKPVCTTIIVQEEDVPGANDGIARVIAEGGTAPYSYLWDDGQTTEVATGLGIGTYSVTVTDANGCTTTCEVELKAPARIGDFVWLDLNRNGIQDPGEPGIPGVTVIVTGVVEDEPYSDTTVTNANGLYFFDVPPPGNYKVTFVLPPGSDLTPTIRYAGGDDTKDSNMDPVTFMTEVVFIERGDVNLTLDAGFYDFCVNLTSAGTIGYDQYLCGPGGTPSTIIELTEPQGGLGEIEYLWMQSTIGGPFNNQNWTAIPNSNTRNYTPGTLYETTYFIRCTRRENCPFLETNIVAVVVGNETVAEINGPPTACKQTLTTFTATNEGPGATYQWDLGPAAVPRFVTGINATTTFSSFGSFEIKLTVSQGGCTSSAVRRLTVLSTCGGLTIDANAVNNEAVNINWNLPEDGLDYTFAVEHSKDGELFAPIAEVHAPAYAAGGLRHYTYMDDAPKKGYNYYRIRTVDAIGREAQSNVASVVLYAGSELMHFFPNPVQDQLTVEIFDAMNDEVTLQVVNINGTILQTVQVPRNADRQQLDFSNLPAGTYFIKVRYGRIDVKVLKVLKP